MTFWRRASGPASSTLFSRLDARIEPLHPFGAFIAQLFLYQLGSLALHNTALLLSSTSSLTRTPLRAMGLLTIIRKNRRKAKEMRLLFLSARAPDSCVRSRSRAAQRSG
jgi:hypothetical protein